ncbi:MAG TPA: glycosyltransferase family 4 protein [Stellaceae bacterium]|nr:glycosyltransferase family 4 protein [Stellaceae bacterium]
MTALALLLPGAIDQRTGGYLYARHLVDALGARGRAVRVHELAGRFPAANDVARGAAAAALAGLPPGAAAVIDGLALPGFADCLADEARRLRLVALVHHSLALETGLDAASRRRFAALEAQLLPLFAGIICPSRHSAAAVEAHGVARARIAVVPPGTARPARPPPHPPHAGKLRLLSVASVTPRKGHLVLVDALARLKALPWRLTIIGGLGRDPAYVGALRQRIAAHRLGARVALAGEWPTARLYRAYAAADLFMLASFHEGYGMALAEAMAYALPIVATAAGAIPETVPASAGILVPPGDAAALAAALARVIADRALRRRLGRAAAVAKLPSWDDTARRFATVCDRLLG